MLVDEEYLAKIKAKPFVTQKMTELMQGGKLKAMQDDLQAQVKKTTKTSAITCGIMAAVLFVLCWLLAELPVYIFAVIITGIVFRTIMGSARTRAKNQYAAMLAPIVIKSLYGDNSVYRQKGGFSRQYLEGLNAFPVRTLDQEDYIQGTYDGVFFQMADVESYHIEVSGSGKDRHEETVIDFLGSVLSFAMNKPSPYLLKVTEGSSLFSGKSIDFESEAFNKKFNVYCQNEENAFYIITPQLQLAMLQSEKVLPGGMTLLFRGRELVVILSGNTTQFNGIDFKKSENYNINAILDAILTPAYVVENMNLDHKFFVSEADVKQAIQGNSSESPKLKQDLEDLQKRLPQSDALTKEEAEKIQSIIEENTK